MTVANIETIPFDRKSLDFTSYRLAGSDHLSDEITMHLSRALSVIRLVREIAGYDDCALGVIEDEIQDAQLVTRHCECKIDDGCPS